MGRLIDEFPESFAGIQWHVSDAYAIAYAADRAKFYSVSGVPTVVFDGQTRHVGVIQDDEQMYQLYLGTMNSCLAVATDVTVEVSAEETAAQTYDITATVGIEASGVGKDVVLHFVQVLDHYPVTTTDYYRNTVMQHVDGGEYTLAAGESMDVTVPFTISGVSWTNVEDARIVVFAQEPGNHYPKIMYNAAVLNWPFVSDSVEGDVDGDGDVDLSDLSALLASYGLCLGDDGYLDAADFIDDDCIDLSDLAVLLGNYGYGT